MRDRTRIGSSSFRSDNRKSKTCPAFGKLRHRACRGSHAEGSKSGLADENPKWLGDSAERAGSGGQSDTMKRGNNHKAVVGDR
jgi:hypothetical protein